MLKLMVSILMVCAMAFANYKTPLELGYTFPDEWEEHEATMMIFPARHNYGRQTRALRKEFAALANAIAQNEPVVVFALNEDVAMAEELFAKEVEVVPSPATIDWARDNAPMVLVNDKGEKASAGFRFNGWGRKYEGWQNDALVRDKLSKLMNWPIFHSDFVLEGGSIEIGNGIGIVTESCVLNKNRAEGWSKAEVEEELKNMLGLKKIIWLKSGLMPDKITDGHVDGICKIIAKETVLLHTTDYKSDINYKICQEAKKTLLEAGFKVVELPLAEDVVHMNFYIGNGSVAYVPVCGDPKQDKPALKIIGKYFKKVVPVKAVEIGRAGGGIHCYTQQIPK